MEIVVEIVGGIIAAVLGLAAIYNFFSSRFAAKRELRLFILKTIKSLNDDIQSYQKTEQSLDDDQQGDIVLNIGRQKLIEDLDRIPASNLKPVIPYKSNSNAQKLEAIRDQLQRIQGAKANLVTIFTEFGTSFKERQAEIAAAVKRIVAFTDALVTANKSGRITPEIFPFVNKFDKIVFAWHQSSPYIEDKIIGGTAVNPYVLDFTLFKPLGAICREHNDNTMSLELIGIVQDFWLSFDAFKKERNRLKVALIEARDRISISISELEGLAK